MSGKFIKLTALAALAFSAPPALAEGWCDLTPGWQVTTHGGKAENVFILGRLQGSGHDIWLQIADASIGKANVAMALGAQLAGKNLSVYLDQPSATCTNYASWSAPSTIRHVRLID